MNKDEDSTLLHAPLTKLVVVMCGLPARARKLARYLTWLGHRSRIFNVGNYRRKLYGASVSSDFYDPDNKESRAKREMAALNALEDTLAWLLQGGPHSADGATPLNPSPPMIRTSSIAAGVAGPSSIAVFDATNSTRERRHHIYRSCADRGVKCFFIENVCDDQEIIMKNITEVKLSSPDYVGWNSNEIIDDFQQRIAHYERAYETLQADECDGRISFVRVLNIGKQVTLNLVSGYLESRIVYFIMNLNTTPKSFFISRHGESRFNLEGKIGGDSDLSPQGLRFAEKLPEVIKEIVDPEHGLVVWVSTLKRFNIHNNNRTNQTAFHIPYTKLQWKQLDELSSGVCDGLTYEEIEAQYPTDFAERDEDKYNYRYHGGESYRDLVYRLEPVIMELERHADPNMSIYIIAHQAVIRAIYAYFQGVSHDALPYIKVPLHTIIKLTPRAYGCVEEQIKISVPAVDTHRKRKN